MSCPNLIKIFESSGTEGGEGAGKKTTDSLKVLETGSEAERNFHAVRAQAGHYS